jgi:hypothetical protein
MPRHERFFPGGYGRSVWKQRCGLRGRPRKGAAVAENQTPGVKIL